MAVVRADLPMEVRFGNYPPASHRRLASAVHGLPFMEAEASIRVPSTEKCSLDRRFFTLGCPSTAIDDAAWGHSGVLEEP